MVDPKEPLFLKAYDQYADALFRYCYLRLYDRTEARDMVQEAFLRTWRYLGEKGPIENIRAFLYKIATNLIINKNQRKRATSLDVLLEKGFDPGFDDRERRIDFLDGLRVMEKLSEIDPKYKEALYLRYVEDLSPKEIAEILEENENAVSVRIHRGIKKLKEHMSYEA